MNNITKALCSVVIVMMVTSGFAVISSDGSSASPPSKKYIVNYVNSSTLNAETRTVDFAGYTWNVKSGYGGPGQNNWSDTEENVWVDGEGWLHLKITNKSGTWNCPEVYTKHFTHYGKHRFYVIHQLDELDKNVVVGLFLYKNDTNEVDIEFSRWGVENPGYNAQYVVQPWQNEGNIERFLMQLSGTYTTHYMDWNSSEIGFKSIHGHYEEPPDDNHLIHEWAYTGDDIPAEEGNLRVHINMWLQGGNPPSDGQEVEIIIKDANLPPPQPVHNLNTWENFSAIQAAIDDLDTEHGHTITVDAGTYNENIIINKSLKLIGEDKNTTIIKGIKKSVIQISSDDVILRGFTIKNGDVGIYSCSDNNIITNNIISSIKGDNGYAYPADDGDDGVGIYLHSSTNIMISGNMISNIKGGNGRTHDDYPNIHAAGTGGGSDGIYLDSSTNITISGNMILSIKGGSGGGCAGPYCTYAGKGGESDGIYLYSSHTNKICNNIVSDITGGSGGYSNQGGAGGRGGKSNGIYLYSSANNELSDNMISSVIGGHGGFNSDRGPAGNARDGVGVYLSSSINATISGNTISSIKGGKGGWGYFGAGGDGGDGNAIDSSISTTISDNTISSIEGGKGGDCSSTSLPGGDGGDGYGICPGRGNMISNNTISYAEGGLKGSDECSHSEGRNGKGYGIYAKDTTHENLIYQNNILDSSTKNGYDFGTNNSWDNDYPSGGNYWSDHTCHGNPSNSSEPYYIDADSIDRYPFQDPNGWLLGENKPPIAIFTYNPEKPVVNQMITFNASSSYDSDGFITKYDWDFGDGNITNTTEEVINHSYSLAGDYIVNLTVTDNDGATSATAKMITVSGMPDLIITDTWLCWPDNCTICYNVTNTGDGTAPACHNTTLYVDGVAVAYDHVPVDLAPGESYIGCFNGYVWTYTPPSDNITVCADNNETVDELDENNNCLTNIWMCGDVTCDGKVTMSDVRKVFNRYLDPNYPLDLPWAADVNCDGKVTMSDVRKVFNRYLDPDYDLNCCCEV